MPSLSGGRTGRAYWRSLDELADSPAFRAFVEREFPRSATELLQGPTRRRFLQLMGASFALAGMTACRRWPEETLAPYAHRPEGRTPGEPERYATAMELGGAAVGLLVTSYDGRPIKVEGNPAHPASRGAAHRFAQASVLELYDPDRSRFPVQRTSGGPGSTGQARTWEDFDRLARPHFAKLRDSGGAGLAVLTETSSSPSVARMRARFLAAFPQARWYTYEPISRDHEREGARLAFGRPLRTHLHFDRAEVIACFDADILGDHPNGLAHARDWAEGRRSADEGRMNRLFVLESAYTLTGAVADHREAAAPSVLTERLDELAKLVLRAESAGEDARRSDVVSQLAADLLAHRGRSVIVAGASQPPEVHALVHRLNAELGNVGTTVTYTAEPDDDRPTCVQAIRTLAGDMAEGKVETLLILGGNPLYDAPADVSFAEALARVPLAIHLSLYHSETSRACAWQVPRAHWLESWGDARAWDGTVSVVQPLIRPLYGGRSVIELLAMLLDELPADGYEIVRQTFGSLLPANGFDKAWRRALHDGVLEGSAAEAVAPELQADAAAAARERVTELGSQAGERTGGVELVFRADYSLYDGRFANNGWLMEAPDPMTRVAWDNPALIDPATAKAQGVTTGDVVKVSVDGRELEMAAYVMPGQAAGCVTLPLGYGRTVAGHVGNGVGFDTYGLRTGDAMEVAAEAELTRTGRTYALASTQDHHAIDTVGFEARKQRIGQLVREATLEEYRGDPGFAAKLGPHAEESQLWAPPVPYNEHRWGMAIDLNACIGCNACVLACQAENNIPIVGKEQVLKGREMHWIRVDRYFAGEADDPSPEVVHQPVACHHCENAPCEQVCPVSATVHDTEGLNVMVYNRCVGTRYCSNNCPYKVRRFNFLDYHSQDPRGGPVPWLGMPDSQQEHEVDPIKRMVFNPEATVRMRGVMEKCTYCIQRIQGAKIKAKNDGRPVADGEITPACAQTCPTQVIVFGDLNDPNSRVRRLQENNRAYGMLAELNVRPRTKYLARVRNPAPSPGREPEAGDAKEHSV